MSSEHGPYHLSLRLAGDVGLSEANAALPPPLHMTVPAQNYGKVLNQTLLSPTHVWNLPQCPPPPQQADLGIPATGCQNMDSQVLRDQPVALQRHLDLSRRLDIKSACQQGALLTSSSHWTNSYWPSKPSLGAGEMAQWVRAPSITW